jgi:hypothetical protein
MTVATESSLCAATDSPTTLVGRAAVLTRPVVARGADRLSRGDRVRRTRHRARVRIEPGHSNAVSMEGLSHGRTGSQSRSAASLTSNIAGESAFGGRIYSQRTLIRLSPRRASVDGRLPRNSDGTQVAIDGLLQRPITTTALPSRSVDLPHVIAREIPCSLRNNHPSSSPQGIIVLKTRPDYAHFWFEEKK